MQGTRDFYDVIVIGGGHAGLEAAHAAARMGCEVLLVTVRRDRLGHMACNPSVGGAGKGHIAREVEALGGLIGQLTDRASIHCRFLNESKGPAVRALRAQVDKKRYQREAQRAIQQIPRLTVLEDMAEDILLKGDRVVGVSLQRHGKIGTRAVILTTGTFLRGCIHVGDRRYPAGRRGDPPAVRLGAFLEELGLEMARFKTGTPPRVHAESVDWSRVEPIHPPDERLTFSFLPPPNSLPQVPTFRTHTTPHTHEIIRANLHRSAMYGGYIRATGARYCPSIEDKVVKFADKEAHHVFLEPEGLDTNSIYVSGTSNSLPPDVQDAMLHTIPGLEHAEILLYGYAIEYDVVLPHQLRPTLELRNLEGLFLAGQINGTSGYEEAAGQGWVAGVNAACKVLGLPEVVLGRDQAYIGVLIDDLVTRGTDEPYRIFTARAEHRLVLRWDNADLRLTPLAHRLGLISGERWKQFQARKARLERAKEEIMRLRVQNGAQKVPLSRYLRRPEVRLQEFLPLLSVRLEPEDIVHLETEFKYEAYILRQQALIEKMRHAERIALPEDLDYERIPGLCTEARQKLARVRPRTLGQASRIPGIRASDLANLLIYLHRLRVASQSLRSRSTCPT